MFRRSRFRIILLIAVALIFIGFTGGVTFLLYQRFFQDGGQSTESRSRASSALGTVKMRLVADETTRYVKDTFTVKVMLDTSGKKVSGIAFGFEYPSGSLAIPDLDVVDSDPAVAGPQIQASGLTLDPCFGTAAQVNKVSRATAAGNKQLFIDYAMTCVNAEGYVTPVGQEVEIARITFKANAPGTFTITSVPTRIIVTEKETGNDILQTVPDVTFTVQADTQKPTIAIISDSTGTGAQGATASGEVSFVVQGTEVPARPADTVKPANYIEYSYRFNAEAFSAWNANATINKVVPHGTHKLEVRARDLAGNISTTLSRTFVANLQPTISSVTPNSAAGGTEVTLDGFNFGPTKGLVYFGTVPMGTTNILEWTNRKIRVKVPATANGGTIAVKPAGTTPASATIPFTLLTKVRLVFAVQGISENRGDRMVDVTIIQGTKKKTLTNQVAKWNTTEAAYELVTDDVGPEIITGAATISIKDDGHLRRKFVGLSVVRGAQVSLVKKAVADRMIGGDFNNDNKINISDFGLMMSQVKALSNAVSATNKRYDLNGDGSISIADIAILTANYTALEIPGNAE